MTHAAAHASQIPPDLRLSAARRLVSGIGPARERAARRLIETAPQFGIDLDLLWGTTRAGRDGRPVVAQVCLAVLGSGRTAMLFVSGPGEAESFGAEPQQADERVEAIQAAIRGLGAIPVAPVLAQALPEPSEDWAVRAFRSAQMTWVGDLAYLRRDDGPVAGAPPLALPDGVSIAAVRDVGDFNANGDGRALIDALDASYEGTLDCPELCGLRSTRDVLASHHATGVFDPGRWWIIRKGGAPSGCMLFTHCPDHDSMELVYLGLAPSLRGLKLGETLLNWALGRVSGVAREVTCAVDRRNEPAKKLYAKLGFEEFTGRVAFVHRIEPARSP